MTRVSIFKSNNSLAKKLLGLILSKDVHFYKKINKCVGNSCIKSHFDYLRNLLQNDTFSKISFKEELTDFQKHIRLVIILASVVVSISILICSVFLIKCIRKKRRNLKKETSASEINSGDISNLKRGRKNKDNRAYEMRNICNGGKAFLRGSTPCPLNRNKTFFTNPINNQCNNIEGEETIEELSESINDYSEYSFTPVSEFKDNHSKSDMDPF